MAQILISLDFDLNNEDELSAILDRVHEVIEEAIGCSPSIGLQVDGEHRDPDAPADSLF
jgi:hypothetical protein